MKSRQPPSRNRNSRLRRWLGLEKFEHRYLLAGPGIAGEEAFVNIDLDWSHSAFMRVSFDQLDASSFRSYDAITNSLRQVTVAESKNAVVDLVAGGITSQLASDEKQLLLLQVPAPTRPDLSDVVEPFNTAENLLIFESSRDDYILSTSIDSSPQNTSADYSAAHRDSIGESVFDKALRNDGNRVDDAISITDPTATPATSAAFGRTLVDAIKVEPYIVKTAVDASGIPSGGSSWIVRGEGESIRLVEGSRLYAAAQRQDAAIVSAYRQQALEDDANRIADRDSSDVESPQATLQGSPAMLVSEWTAWLSQNNRVPEGDSASLQRQDAHSNVNDSSRLASQWQETQPAPGPVDEHSAKVGVDLATRFRQTLSGPTVIAALAAIVRTWFFGSQNADSRPGYEYARLPLKRERKKKSR
jgi:hypothetical protein